MDTNQQGTADFVLANWRAELADHAEYWISPDSVRSFEDLIVQGEELAALQDTVNRTIDAWVICACLAGASWRQVGDALGISRQAAQQRWPDAMEWYRDTPLPGLD